jgi:hypothetical protein
MSASPLAVTLAIAGQTGALAALNNLLNPIPKGNIGGIAVQTTIEEAMTDSLDITENPVEQGADITDHAYVKPSNLVMRCGWSNSNPSAALNAVVSLFTGGSLSVHDYVSSVYAQLLALQQSRQPFTVSTSIRLYQNMLMPTIALTRDKTNSQALMVTVTMKNVLLVSTQTTTLPPVTSQANPASTAETMNAGPLASIAGQTPAPGGSLPSASWTPTSTAGPLASLTN